MWKESYQPSGKFLNAHFHWFNRSSISFESMASFQPIGVLESSVGCSRHIQEALRELGVEPKIINSASDLKEVRLVIFAESGHIESVVQNLKERELWSALYEYTSSGRPFLGVATGMHILFESSDDHPELELLGVLPGSVAKLESWEAPVPHIGWNDISCIAPSCVASGGYAEDAPSVYFAHTYCINPGPENIPLITSVTDYGDQRFISTIVKDYITGVQFHPELSGATGLNFLKEFIDKHYRNDFAVESIESTLRLEDFGELQALPMTVPSIRVVALVHDGDAAAQAFANGADEVIRIHEANIGHNGSSAYVPVPVAAHSSQGMEFESAAAHLRTSASRVVINANEAVRAVVDFLTSGIASGESAIERLSRRYGAHAVVVEICAERVLLENPMQPFKRAAVANADPSTITSNTDGDAENSAIAASAYDEEAFPTLGAAHSTSIAADYNAAGVGSDSGLVQIIAECEEEHDMLAMLRGMGRTVVHLAEEQAALFKSVEDNEAAVEASDRLHEVNRMTHCWYSVSVPGDDLQSESVDERCIDAVVLAKACEILGAGEILLRGTTSGQAFDRPLLNAVQNAVSISVLAAPATGVNVTADDYLEVFEGTRVKAVTVESSIVALRGLKQTLRSAGVEVR